MLQVWLEKEKKCTSQIPDVPFSSSYLCSGYLCDCHAFPVNDHPPHSFILLDPSSEPSQCFSDHTGGHPCIPGPPGVFFYFYHSPSGTAFKVLDVYPQLLCILVCFYVFVILLFFSFEGMHLWLLEVSRLGIQFKLQLPASTRATATWDPSHVCNLYHSWR